MQKAKEESDRLAAEKKKKKPIRYPTEDLDIAIGDKEKKQGMKLRRPIASRASMPFGTDRVANENFLMSWNFLVVYGYVFLSVLQSVILTHLKQPAPHIVIHYGRI